VCIRDGKDHVIQMELERDGRTRVMLVTMKYLGKGVIEGGQGLNQHGTGTLL